MFRTLALAAALSALAGAAAAQADPYGLPPGYAPVSYEPANGGHPQPKEYTDADYGDGYQSGPGHAQPYSGPAYDGPDGDYAPAEDGYGTGGYAGRGGYVDQGGYAGGHYNSGSSAARRCCVSSHRGHGGHAYGGSSYSSYTASSYASASAYAESAYASRGEADLYVAPFAYQRRAEAYYEATGTAEAAAWDRSRAYGYAERYRQDLGDLHLDSSFFAGGLTGGVEGGPPVWVGGGGGGYVTSSASASAFASARASAYARTGGRGGKSRCGGCR